MPYVFDETTATPLCEIMGRYKSDKGSITIKTSWHNYTTLYHSLFNGIRDKPLRIFELGVGTTNPSLPSSMGANGVPGASLYGWREYFPHATVFGADIDGDCLFLAERIRTFPCDQRNPDSVQSLWKNPDLKEPLDILIDDGLHEFSANVCFFENSIHKLKSGGYYIIEDICEYNLPLFHEKLVHWKRTYTDLTFDLINIPSIVNTKDNIVLIIHKPELTFTCDITHQLTKSLDAMYPIDPTTPMHCVEIGSFEGRGSLLIAKRLCQHAESRLTCIDPLDNEYVAGDERMAFWNSACHGQRGRFYNNTRGIRNLTVLQGTSDAMIPRLENGSVDFVYIDGDHSPEQVYKDAVNMFPKMKKGSILLFDDYEWEMNGMKTKLGIDRFLAEYAGRVELLVKHWQLGIRVTA